MREVDLEILLAHARAALLLAQSSTAGLARVDVNIHSCTDELLAFAEEHGGVRAELEGHGRRWTCVSVDRDGVHVAFHGRDHGPAEDGR